MSDVFSDSYSEVDEMIQIGSEVSSAHRKVLLWGLPKNSGKTTFAMSAPGPILALMCGIGGPSIPPGVDPNTITYKTYPPADPGVEVTTDKWKRSTNVGTAILTDLMEVRSAFIENRPIHIDNVDIPLPRTFVLDDWTIGGQHLLDWMLGVNNKKDASDFNNPFELWGRRLTNGNSLFNMLLPIPANVIIISWQTNVTKTEKDSYGKAVIHTTDKVTPDIGGKMDTWGTGKVDASLYCFSTKESAGTRFKVRTKGTELIQGVGVRGIYDLPDIVDVTIDPKKPGPLPWERIFGKSVAKVAA